MHKNDFIHQFWKYYLTLEDDFNKTTRFVEIDPINYSTYSVEFAKQYQAICSEIDVTLKELTKHIDSTRNCSNIKEYAEVILNKYPEFISAEVVIKNSNSSIKLTPWSEWTNTTEYKSPIWWSNYNKVKHQRTTLDSSGSTFFQQANLHNVLNALAGLFVVEMYFCREISDASEQVKIPIPVSTLFSLSDWESHILLPSDGMLMVDLSE